MQWKPPQTYVNLLRKKNVPVSGVFYRGGGSLGYEFKPILVNPDEDTLHRMYGCEVELQGQFPLVHFDFHLEFSPLTREQRAKLSAEGFQRYKSK